MTANPNAASPKPVTVMVSRRVRRGQAAEFERLMSGMQRSAAGFPGHMGGFLIPPDAATEEGCWRMLFAFDAQANLDAWCASPERQHWLRHIAEVTHGDTVTRVLSGLETWFALPAARTKAPPPRWKMAIVTWLGIYPLVALMTFSVNRVLALWLPLPLVLVIATMVIVGAMTWLVMPILVRLLAGWLYPVDATAPAPVPPTTHRSTP